SSPSLPARGDLARAAVGDEPVPSSTAPAVVPLPTTPPARTPRGSGVRLRSRWPALAGFLVACFLAGLFLVGRLVADEPAPGGRVSEPASRGAPTTPAEELAAREEPGDGTQLPTGASSAPDDSNESAVPLDQVLGEAETEPTRKASARKRATSSQQRRPPARPKKARQKKPQDIDFGF